MCENHHKENFIKKLHNVNKILIGEYYGSDKSVTIQCLKCSTIKTFSATRVALDFNCSVCSDLEVFNKNQAIFEQHCVNINYTLITNFNGNKKPITIKCNNCGDEKEYSQAYNVLKRDIDNKFSCCAVTAEKYTEQQIIEQLEKFNYTLISRFRSMNKPIDAACNNCNNHVHYNSAGQIFKMKRKCLLCSDSRSIKYTINDIKSICNNYGFKLLDDKFISTTWHHNFECKNGHRHHKSFETLNTSFKNNKNTNQISNGCNECAILNRRKSQEFIENKLKDKNFELLERYETLNKKYLIRCLDCKLIRKIKIRHIVCGESKCINCRDNTNESFTGNYLKDILKDDIVISRHKIIKEKIYYKNEKIRNFIYVDFYFEIENKKYIVEYNGIQHYEPVRFSKSCVSEEDAKIALKHQKIRDGWLIKYCKQNNIILIEIDGRKYKGINIKEYLQNYFNLACGADSI